MTYYWRTVTLHTVIATVAHTMTLKNLKNSVISLVIALTLVFAVGHQSTLDAVIATFVWVFLIFALLALIAGVIGLYVIGQSTVSKETRKAAAPFYKALSEIDTGWLQRSVSLAISAVWLYGLIIHEWTATAVMYVLISMLAFAFSYASKDAVKNFFIESLKGDEA